MGTARPVLSAGSRSRKSFRPCSLLLGSRANSYIVGANIAVDGGTDFSTG